MGVIVKLKNGLANILSEKRKNEGKIFLPTGRSVLRPSLLTERSRDSSTHGTSGCAVTATNMAPPNQSTRKSTMALSFSALSSGPAQPPSSPRDAGCRSMSVMDSSTSRSHSTPSSLPLSRRTPLRSLASPRYPYSIFN